MDSTTLVLCLFSLLCQAQGDKKEETLYVKTGTDFLLDVGEHVTLKENEQMFWKFNSKVNIVRLTDTNEIVHQNYTGRAVLSQNQSLLLKNVQKTDSGEYRAEFSGNKDRVLVKHQVTVLDPVSDVKLEVKQCGSNWPDLALTCTTLDNLLSSTFFCNKTTCSHEGGELTLKVYLKSGSVTCHHSNQVSVKEDTKTVEDLCENGAVYLALKHILAVIAVVIFAAAALAAFCLYRRHKGLILKSHVIQVQPDEDNTDGGNNTDNTRLQGSEGDRLLGVGPSIVAQSDPRNTIYSKTGTSTASTTNPSGESEGQETSGPTDIEDSEGDPLQGPGPSFGAQSDPRNTIYPMTDINITVDPIKPSGEAKRIILKMQEDLHKLLQPLHENEPLEPGPSDGAQGHIGQESWNFWTGEDLVLYFKKPVALKKDDVELKVKVWQRSASLIHAPTGQGTWPRRSPKIFYQSGKNKENMTEK